MKYLIECQDGHGERLYLRQKNRYGEWTYYRPDARRFESREEARKILMDYDRKHGIGFRFVVRADQNMEFSVFPPKVVSRVWRRLMERASASR